MKNTTPLQRRTPMARGTSTMSRGAGFKPAEKKPAAGAKPKACRVCRVKFVPSSPLAVVCGVPCAVEHGRAVTAKQKAKAQREERAVAKAQRALDRIKLEKMTPAKWWKAKAKKAMHLFVRTRDAGKPCASCDTVLVQAGRLGGDYDAGHFRSVGSAKHLEFDERNIFGQCKYCNDTLHSNPQEYERRLRLLKGDAFVDELLADQAPRHYKAADYQAIEAHYKSKLAELKKGEK